MNWYSKDMVVNVVDPLSPTHVLASGWMSWHDAQDCYPSFFLLAVVVEGKPGRGIYCGSLNYTN